MTDAPPKSYSLAVATVPRYSYLHQHSSRVGIGLCNLTSRPVTIKAKTPVAQITAANVIPPMLAPKVIIKSNTVGKQEETDASKGAQGATKLSPEKLEKLFSKLDLSGIADWSEQEQKEVKDLITEFGSIFALDDMDLGKTSIVKHTIKLTDPVPFKEYYRHISPSSV